jgi:hypothetical protein
VLHLVVDLGVLAREERLPVAEDLVDDITGAESSSQNFVSPVDLGSVIIELLFVGEVALEVIRCSELKFIGDFDVSILECAAIVPHLSDVADTEGKRALVALNHLLAQGLIGDVASLDRSIQRWKPVGQVRVEEVPISRCRQCLHAKDVVRFLAIDEEFEGDRGSQTVGVFKKICGL